MITKKTIVKSVTPGIVVITLAIAFSLGIAPAFARESEGERGTGPSAIGRPGEARMTNNIDRLRSRGEAEIDRRVTALNKLLTKVTTVKRLTDAQKSTFTSGIQGQITTLTNLKAKIDADTDIATLRTDIQLIVKSYRIFAVYMPQVEIMVHADRLLALVDQMNQISTKLQARIDAAKAAGHDTASMQSLMTDRTSKLADATTQANNAINTVMPLTPDGYPGNRSALMSARSMLQTARRDLVAAEKDASEVRRTLKSFGKSGSPTTAPTP